MEKAKQTIVRIEDAQTHIVEQWSMEKASDIQFSLSKFVLVRVENGLLQVNFDESVSFGLCRLEMKSMAKIRFIKVTEVA